MDPRLGTRIPWSCGGGGNDNTVLLKAMGVWKANEVLVSRWHEGFKGQRPGKHPRLIG